jgi:hypothetical protein
MKAEQNPYPWYADNAVTRRLEPYAAYAASREDFNRRYQPESDSPLIENGHLDVKALEESVRGDDERSGWLCDEPIMRDIAYFLKDDPKRFSALDQINAKYMDGFQHENVFDQARIHMMTACRLMGHWDDDIIAKKWLRNKTLELWARAWHRGHSSGIGRYFPAEDELDARYSQLPPIHIRNTKKRKGKRKRKAQWPWERVYSSIGLDTIRQADTKRVSPKNAPLKTAFEFEVTRKLPPEISQALKEALKPGSHITELPFECPKCGQRVRGTFIRVPPQINFPPWVYNCKCLIETFRKEPQITRAHWARIVSKKERPE